MKFQVLFVLATALLISISAQAQQNNLQILSAACKDTNSPKWEEFEKKCMTTGIEALDAGAPLAKAILDACKKASIYTRFGGGKYYDSAGIGLCLNRSIPLLDGREYKVLSKACRNASANIEYPQASVLYFCYSAGIDSALELFP